jgi:hypothetical protein
MPPVNELLQSLQRAPALVVPMVRQAHPAVLKVRPPSGKWSIHEHACHLAQVHPLFFERLELMLTEDNPAIHSYDPGRDDPDDALLNVALDEALSRFGADRRRLVERLESLTSAQWLRTGRHDEYNSYSVFTMFRHLALHDFFHAYRIEELLLFKHWPAPTTD